MPEFIPVNTLEISLRAILRDQNTPSWSFYTPLAAAPLWTITRINKAEPDSDNRDIQLFGDGKSHFIGLFTAEIRAKEAFNLLKLSTDDFKWDSAPGYQLLAACIKLDVDLWINLGLKDCQYCLDPDMVEILLSRPEPDYDAPPARREVSTRPQGDPERHLGPLKDFLATQPTVRAAWIFGQPRDPSQPAGESSYEVALLMVDPEDNSLIQHVTTMAKALTPVEMEWTAGVLMADDRSLRHLSEQRRPFYVAPGFLKEDG